MAFNVGEEEHSSRAAAVSERELASAVASKATPNECAVCAWIGAHARKRIELRLLLLRPAERGGEPGHLGCQEIGFRRGEVE